MSTVTQTKPVTTNSAVIQTCVECDYCGAQALVEGETVTQMVYCALSSQTMTYPLWCNPLPVWECSHCTYLNIIEQQ